MTCDEARDLLLERPSGDADLQRHLAGCRDCAAVKEEMGRIDAFVAPLRGAPVPESLLARRPRRSASLIRLLPLAAAAAMLVSISLIVAFWKPAPGAPAGKDRQEKAVGGLELSVRTDKARYEYKEPITFTGTFENVGDREVLYHKPETAQMDGFPTYRIAGAGQVWQIYVPPYQTMQTSASEGMSGSLEKVKPRERRSYPIRALHFTKGDITKPLSLPEGDYTVTAVYELKESQVEYNNEEGKPELRPVQKLWTGKLSSLPAAFHVGAARELACAIEAPREGAKVRVAITNPLPAPVRVAGRATLSVHSKAFGGGSAAISLKEEAPLAPGESRNFSIDLCDLAWTSSDPNQKLACGIADFAPLGGWMDCTLDLEGSEKDVKKIAAPGRLISWSLDETKPPGLTLSLQMKDPLLATVKLTNTGSTPAVVNKRFRYACDVAFELTDPKGEKGAACTSKGAASNDLNGLWRPGMTVMSPVIIEGLAWSSDVFPKPEPLLKNDFATLAPGASVEGAYDLRPYVYGGLPQGSYQVQAIYMNLEPAVRLGLQRAHVGKLTSNAVSVEVPKK